MDIQHGYSLPIQTTAKGEAYKKWIDEVRNLLDSPDPTKQKKAAMANLNFCRGIGRPTRTANSVGYVGKGTSNPSSVHVDAILTTLSVMYTNDEYVGERIVPAVSVTKRSDKYWKYPKRERFAYPDDSLSSRSKANEVQASRDTDNYSVEDFGFLNFIDNESLNNQDAPLNEMVDLIEQINEGIAFKREKRIATVVQDSANYGGNTAGAGSKWDGSTGGSIFADLLGADAALWRGQSQTRKVGVTTLDNWNSCIVRNAALLDAIKYTQTGIVTPTLVANFFGLDDLVIGRAREDTANEGQTESFSRMWSTDFFAIISVATRPTTRSLHFASNFRLAEDPVTTQWTDASIGKSGGIYARVAVSEDLKVVAGDAAFFISDVKT